MNNSLNIDKAHSVFPPSSAARHINCTPSLRLEELFPDTESDAAKEGTVAHAFAEWKLYKLGGKEMPLPSYEDFEACKADIDAHTDAYADFVKDWMLNGFKDEKVALVPEHKVTFETWVPGGFGTADCVLVSNTILHIIDFKYGISVPVHAENNTQMKIYALGALETWGKKFPNIKRVRMSIFQPRNAEGGGTWELTKDELLDWAETVLKPAAALALEGKGEFRPGDWCRYCKARNTCKARTAELTDLFDKVDEAKPAALYTDEELIKFLPRLKEMAKWCTETYDYLLKKAEDGETIPGYEVKQGRKTENITKETEAEFIKTLKDFGVSDDDIYETKLRTVAQIRKNVTPEVFNKLSKGFITVSYSKGSLKKTDDPADIF